MPNTKMKYSGVLGMLALVCSVQQAWADDVKTDSEAVKSESPMQFFTDGSIFAETRFRFEYVDQDGPLPIASEAEAGTVRVNLGVKTGKYLGLQGLVEGQLVEHLTSDDFNDTVNGKTTYPVVADPDNLELNQAWLSFTAIPDTEIKGGRQGINLGNQRFIGTVGWRQNDQTFDSAMITNSSIPKTTLKYGYIWNVNRVFGDDHPLGDLDSDAHFINATFSPEKWFNLTGYGYWFDFNNFPAGSTRTYGVQANGSIPAGEKVSFPYHAEWAKQNDYKNNPTSVSEQYLHFTGGVSAYGFTVNGGYERLGGNGTTAFQTPLATLHKFNGWTDKFLITPAAGLEDIYGVVSYKVTGLHEWIDGTQFLVAYHDFRGDTTGDFGSEIGFSVGKTFKIKEEGPVDSVNITFKFADYAAEDAPFTDTQKFWVQLGTKFSVP